jgi:hypothetical protein
MEPFKIYKTIEKNTNDCVPYVMQMFPGTDCGVYKKQHRSKGYLYTAIKLNGDKWFLMDVYIIQHVILIHIMAAFRSIGTKNTIIKKCCSESLFIGPMCENE